jgi:ABC-type transport system involved in multi-copper enzyme maturation permease subunit
VSAIKRREVSVNPSWITRFWAVVKYEILWNIRKRKFLGMLVVAFALATLSLALPVILSNRAGESLSQNPDYVVSYSPGALIFFLFALVTVMNSISGEFESGTIVPLLTKPVSRTIVFLGKLFAAFITLLSAYIVLFVYMVIGGTLVYGPQNNLNLVPLSLLGSIVTTFVWVAMVLALGSISKSSLIVTIGAIGIFLALLISSPIISAFSDQAWVLNYVPGNGETGYIKGLGSQTLEGGPRGAFYLSVSYGTDNIATNLITYVLHPSSNVTFYEITRVSGQGISMNELYTEPLSLVLLRSIAVAATYICVFAFMAWYTFERSQVLE